MAISFGTVANCSTIYTLPIRWFYLEIEEVIYKPKTILTFSKIRSTNLE